MFRAGDALKIHDEKNYNGAEFVGFPNFIYICRSSDETVRAIIL